MPHGMSDKGYHEAERLKTIRHLLYSGPLWKDKLVKQGIFTERIHIVGCPRLDPIFQGKIKRLQGGKARVLWCPTHDAIEEISSYPEFGKQLTGLSGKYEAISSVHPAREDGGKTSLELLVQADVVLSDTSSLIYEALAIGKPVVLLDWLVKDGVFGKIPGTFEEMIYRDGLCYHAASFEELPEVIDTALKNGIDKRTQEFIDGIFSPELRGNSGKMAAETLRRVANEF